MVLQQLRPWSYLGMDPWRGKMQRSAIFRDRRGNYALMTVITMIPLMGGVALAVDYTELVRERQETLNALDAAGIATALRRSSPVQATPMRRPMPRRSSKPTCKARPSSEHDADGDFAEQQRRRRHAGP
ncbi:pilus assembly protein TadG-related protein [Mesorhizobium atlanticum]